MQKDSHAILDRPLIVASAWNWGRRLFWGVLDQGIFSMSGVAINVALARSLTLLDYGAFASSYAIVVLISAVVSMFVVEPILVLGPTEFAQESADYRRAVMSLLGCVCGAVVGLGLIGGAIAHTLGSPSVAECILGGGIAVVGSLYQALTRRLSYSSLVPRLAVVSAVIYLLLVVVAIALLSLVGLLSLVSSYLVIGGAGVVSHFMISRWLRPQAEKSGGRPRADVFRGVVRSHWTYSKWLLLGSPLRWVPRNLALVLMPVVLGAERGLAGAAALRAMTTLVMPIQQASVPVGVLLRTSLATRTDNERRRIGSLAIAGGGVVSLVYWVGVGLAAPELALLIYGGDLAEYGWLVWWLGGVGVCGAVITVTSAILLARRTPRDVAACDLVAATVTVVSVALIPSYGLAGAAASILVGSLAEAVAHLFFAFRTAPPSAPESNVPVCS